MRCLKNLDILGYFNVSNLVRLFLCFLAMLKKCSEILHLSHSHIVLYGIQRGSVQKLAPMVLCLTL